ncbi:MAG: InlB B-repeat-containing protein, partial [Syntrophomonadaceae bacterium]|nr:InlB B-repeat-containing protein [Syntrophomonadaceae bacterium]
MQTKRITNKVLSLMLSVCMLFSMLLQVAYAAEHTINITQQPTSSLTGVVGESPGIISVEATTTNGASITYQWWRSVSGSNMTVGNGTNTFEISSDLIPGTYEYYCELKAESCDAIESERTTVTLNKATYTGIQSDTFYVKADQSTLNNEYTLPNVPMSDMTYTIENNGGNLVTGTSELKTDASTDWRWILIFNTASKPADTEENIILKINGGSCYNDSSFTLTVKAGKLPVSITGIDGTDAEYSGNPQKGYTGEPQTGGFTGALNHHYEGRNTTVYDSGTAPTDAGDYTVTLSIPEDADYSGSKSIDFSIKKKEVMVWPVNYTMPQGETLPTSDSIYVNYIGFVGGDNSNNSISTWAVPKLNVSDSNTPGVSDIDFKTEATLVTEKEKNYTLKHEKSELTIQAKTYCVIVEGSYAPTSGVGDYYSNDTVNIAAGTRDGYTFVNWTSPDGVSFAKAGSASTTFTMPGKDVTVTANWQQGSPTTKYTVIFNANGDSVSPASAQTGIDGKLTALPTPSRSNHRFDGWFTAVSGGTQITTDYVFTANTTIYAHWTYTGSSGGSGGGSSSGSTAQPAVPAADGAVKVNY